MNQQVILISALLLLSTDLASAANRPGSGGGCDGVGPRPRATRSPTGAPSSSIVPSSMPTNEDIGRFLRDIANPARKRALQTNVIAPVEGIGILGLTQAEIDLCCTGNGDFEFLTRDIDVGGLANATEMDGFLPIPGDSRWSCRSECRDPANGYELEPCYDACECRQNCPTSIDFLTQECKSKCNSANQTQSENDLCLEECEKQCGERCRSTLNGYVVPLDIYGEGLTILDCYFGDLIGDSASSCNTGQGFWESSGYTCDVVSGNDFDCECDVPGTCLNAVYPCDYQYYCVSQSPSLVPSETPSKVPSKTPSNSPSDVPSKAPTSSPTPRPTYGKGKVSKRTGRRI